MIFLFLLSACAPSYVEGQMEVGNLNCQRMEACGTMMSGMDLQECQDIAASQPFSEDQCPGYQPSQMQKCIVAYETAIAEEDCESDLSEICLVCKG